MSSLPSSSESAYERTLVRTKSMVCPPDTIRSRDSDVAYKRRMTGKGISFRERQRSRIVQSMVNSSQVTHMQCQHKARSSKGGRCSYERPSRLNTVRPSQSSYIPSNTRYGCRGWATSRANLHRHLCTATFMIQSCFWRKDFCTSMV